MGEIADRAVERIFAEASEYAVDVPELKAAVASGARPSILAELVAMQDGARVPESCPAVDADGARLSARFGVPPATAIWIYRVGHKAQWEAWYRLVSKAVSDRALREALHEAGSDFFFAYADTISAWVTDEYTAERDRLLKGREQRRISVVRELLAGASPDPGPLDYPLELSHIGVVASGEGAAEVVAAFADALGRRALLLQVEDGVCWGWLGAAASREGSAMEAAVKAYAGSDVRVALGAEADGVEGFRRTHEQALAAHRIAVAREPGVVTFEQVEVEVIAMSDPDRARSFVARVLGPLAEGTARAAKLRGTLRAYFATGQNAAATAAGLGVHEQTVANRLGAVEQLTGRTVAASRVELELALRLLGPLSAQPAARAAAG